MRSIISRSPALARSNRVDFENPVLDEFEKSVLDEEGTVWSVARDFVAFARAPPPGAVAVFCGCNTILRPWKKLSNVQDAQSKQWNAPKC